MVTMRDCLAQYNYRFIDDGSFTALYLYSDYVHVYEFSIVVQITELHVVWVAIS
jgi:hypothetical protein